MGELRERPLCGGEAYLDKVTEDCPNYVAGCKNCRAHTSWHSTKINAVTAWNTRPNSWISVEDKLPDTTTVLGCNIEGFVATVLYMSNAKRWTIAPNLSVIMDVTHWMPLPKPPKGDEN